MHSHLVNASPGHVSEDCDTSERAATVIVANGAADPDHNFVLAAQSVASDIYCSHVANVILLGRESICVCAP